MGSRKEGGDEKSASKEKKYRYCVLVARDLCEFIDKEGGSFMVVDNSIVHHATKHAVCR